MVELTENDMLDIEMRLRRGDIRAADMQRLFDAVKPTNDLEDEVDRLQGENDELSDEINDLENEINSLKNKFESLKRKIKQLANMEGTGE